MNFAILTERRYINPLLKTDYTLNVLLEEELIIDSLQRLGHNARRVSWNDNSVEWEEFDYSIFRSTWDYFDRFEEFDHWLSSHKSDIQFINPYHLIRWNLDKKYLIELRDNEIHIPNTLYIKKGNTESLQSWVLRTDWNAYVLKPAISGGGRHTYLFERENSEEHQEIFQQLLQSESMILQEFQFNILTRGEVAIMVFNGEYSHAILKKARKGEFRVQDDFGGSVFDYEPSEEEIEFALSCVHACPTLPPYARVDMIWDNQNQICLSEIELIEPELWFRNNPQSADKFAEAIDRYSLLNKSGASLD